MKKRWMAALLVLCLLTVTGAAFAEPLEDLEVAADETECLEIDAGDDEQEAVPEEAGLLLEDPQEAMMPAEEDSLLSYDGAQGDILESTFVGEEMERTGEETQAEGEGVAELKYVYSGPETLSKVYDKTTNASKLLSTSYFALKPEADHANVKIDSIVWYKRFSAPDAGDYELQYILVVSGSDVNYYKVKKARITSGGEERKVSCIGPFSIPATITKRPVTITPKSTETNPLTKVYGTQDPAGFSGSVSGLLKLTEEEEAEGKKLYTGKLGRVAGENVGKYQITLGTLDFDNDNYEVKLEKAYFAITAKKIGDDDVTVNPIDDHFYTSKAIKPKVRLTYAGKTLKTGTDYKLSYKSNKNPGTAKITVTGKGNFKDTRTVKFKIVDPVELSATKLTISRVDSTTINLTGLYGRKVTWSSSNKSVAKITAKSSGSVTVKAGKKGSATITAKIKKNKTLPAKTLKCKITVVDPLTIRIDEIDDKSIYNDLCVQFRNRSKKKIIYVKLDILQYNNRGDKLKSPYSYYYLNETIKAGKTLDWEYSVHKDTKKVKIKIKEITFSGGKKWKP